MSDKIYKITVSGYGGEYCLGTVTNQEKFATLVELEETEELGLHNEVEIEGEIEDVSFYYYNDIICEYGAVVDYEYYNISEVKEENNKYKEIKEYSFEERLRLKNYSKSNPFLSNEELENNKKKGVVGYFGGISSEKGVFHTFILRTKEELKVENLAVLSINLDETLIGEEIITDMIYMSLEEKRTLYNDYYKLEETMEDYLKELESEEIIEDCFTELIYEISYDNVKKIETPEKVEKLLLPYILEMDNYESATNGKSAEAFLFDIDFERV